MVCGDNISAQRYFVTLSFDGCPAEAEAGEIWDHFIVEGPSVNAIQGPPPGLSEAPSAGTRRLTESA
jgi:hypothetical protein